MLSDGGGLHLFVYSSGSKLWRLRYRFHGKANMLSLGSFPAVPLLTARKQRDELKEQLAAGIDSSLRKRMNKLASTAAAQNTFGAAADEYLANLQKNGAEQTFSKNRWMPQDLAAPIRKRPIAEVKPIEVFDLLKKVEASGRRNTAHRLEAFEISAAT